MFDGIGCQFVKDHVYRCDLRCSQRHHWSRFKHDRHLVGRIGLHSALDQLAQLRAALLRESDLMRLRQRLEAAKKAIAILRGSSTFDCGLACQCLDQGKEILHAMAKLPDEQIFLFFASQANGHVFDPEQQHHAVVVGVE
jgi:hypothetical protein